MVQGVFHCIGVKSLVSRTRSRQSSVRRLGFCQQMQSMWLLIACSCCSTVQRFDPFYSATILHFQDLLKRFGSPIIVLNLIKVRGCALLSRAHVCVASHDWIPFNVYFVCVCGYRRRRLHHESRFCDASSRSPCSRSTTNCHPSYTFTTLHSTFIAPPRARAPM